MVKSCFNKTLVLLFGLFCAVMASAQDLPVLKADSSIKTGVLANGTSYYIVSNPSVKGVADFALVQKTGTANISDDAGKVVGQARESLSSLSRCLHPSVQTFFTSKGVTPGEEGFVKVTENSTEYRFNDVLLSKPEVLDSALLVILSVVDKVSMGDEFLRQWYSPSDQAVIVVGDVNSDQVESKLKLISLMTPAVPSSPRQEYVWEPSEKAEYVHVPESGRKLATFSVSWKSARTPESYMNTIQPVISEMFISELGLIAERRIKEVLRGRNIPVADVSSKYVSSEDTSSDETFTISVSVSEDDFSEALAIVSSVMADVDAGNVPIEDFMQAKYLYMNALQEDSYNPVRTNSEYVDKCTMAFLYNGCLAAQKTRIEFMAGRQLADSTELSLFNNISSALIDPEKNMTLVYSPDVDKESVRNTFTSAWQAGSLDSDARGKRYKAEDIPMFEYDGEKVKMKTDKTDHISGGREWTFSTGFKVVYKRMNTNGKIYYNLALNGGFGSVADLSKGEGAYFTDYFKLAKVKGIPAEQFIDALASAGMTMETYTGLSYTMVHGYAPKDKLDFMLNSLLHMINSRVADEEQVKYYNECETVRNELRKNTLEERVVTITDIMCPNYNHSIHKGLATLEPELLIKADKFFKNQSRSTNDGVLIIIGDLDETLLKKSLINYIGGFRTADRAFKRTMVRYQPVSGMTTYTVDGEGDSVDIALSVPLALTVDNFMTAEISAMVLEKMLSEALIDTGMYIDVTHECKIYPSERMNLHISLNKASVDGYATGVSHSGPIEAMSIVRSVLSGIAEAEFSNDDINVFKTQLKNRTKMEQTGAAYWMNVISRRHLAGKDFTTGYESKIDAVNAAKVKTVLSRLKDATGVEYIVSGK